MAEDNELEKRAIEELLRETARARLRAETMGPAGWLKCPLKSTNKRFLLNTLRSTGLHQRTSEPTSGRSVKRGRLRSESPERRRARSRSPPRHHRNNGGNTDNEHHHHYHHHHHHRGHRSNDSKKEDRDKDRRQKHKKETQRNTGQNTEKDKH